MSLSLQSRDYETSLSRDSRESRNPIGLQKSYCVQQRPGRHVSYNSAQMSRTMITVHVRITVRNSSESIIIY